jgi:Nucleotidyl transferase AbiEii toxin, Type IV TA system
MRQFYDWQTAGGGGDVSLLVATLERLEIPWCMIGGLAVNHWAREPMATVDVDVVIAAEKVNAALKALRAAGFTAKKFKWSVNLKGRSKVSVQISTEDFYADFPARSRPADIHGILMRVASREDTLRGKILAYQDPERRASKRQKDLLDIMRLVEAHPKLKKLLPADLAKKIKD